MLNQGIHPRVLASLQRFRCLPHRPNYTTTTRHPPPHTINRPPIISIMGHVDHGKTTLLDHLRHSRIVQSEAGGITQRLGAFTLPNSNGHSIAMTILDTPGHEAFTTIRWRASHSADIIILVIAIEDGVMPQTEECIRLAEQSRVPLVVAVNKIDKLLRDERELADLRSKGWQAVHDRMRRIEEDLTKYNLMTESFGGDVQVVPISALRGINIPLLLGSIGAQAEMLELGQSDVFEGSVLEASQRRGMGTTATVLVRSGELRVGDLLVTLGDGSSVMARVRSILDVDGRHVQRLGASEPGLVSGWSDVPVGGSQIFMAGSMEEANQLVQENKHLQLLTKMRQSEGEANKLKQQNKELVEERREQRRHSTSHILPNQYDVSQVEARPELRVILVCDAIGSMDAVEKCIAGISQSKAGIAVVSKHLGGITRTDIDHAAVTGSAIVAFPIDIPKSLAKYAEHVKVKVMQHKVIYHLMEEIKQELITKLPPVVSEELVAKAKVLKVFIQSDGDRVYGLHITQGILGARRNQNHSVQVVRSDGVLGDVEIVSMKQEKRVVQEVGQDMQCGVMLKKVDAGEDADWEIKEGDELRMYKRVNREATL